MSAFFLTIGLCNFLLGMSLGISCLNTGHQQCSCVCVWFVCERLDCVALSWSALRVNGKGMRLLAAVCNLQRVVKSEKETATLKEIKGRR